MDQHEAYYMARQGFRAMHPDADIPLTPHGLQWSQTDSDQYLLEADGTKMIATARVPTRWIVHLRHAGMEWTVVKAEWKLDATP